MTAGETACGWPLGWACPAPDQMPLPEFVSLLDALAQAGYAGIEPMISEPYQLDASLLSRLLAQRGLRLIGLRTGGIFLKRGLSLAAVDAEVRRQAVAALRQVIRYGGQFGSPRILVGLIQGPLAQGVSLAQAREWIAAGLGQAAEEAAALNIEIDLEPINRFELGYNCTVADALALICQAGAPNLGLLLDTFHMHIEEPSIAGAVIQAGSHIGHVHLADSNRRAPGQGHFAFGDFLAVLAGVRYQGSLTVECDPIPDQVAALRAAARYLAACTPFPGVAGVTAL